MNKYKHLISNTALFAISTFSSKLLVFLLMPLYTRVLSPEDYGAYDIVVNTCILIIPIMTLTVHEAVVRFGMDKGEKKSDVLSTALCTIFIGYIILWALYPLLNRVQIIQGYLPLIYLYVLTSALRSSITQFVRICGSVRLFAIDGIFTTLVTVGLNVLLLVYFKMGPTSLILSTILADAFSALSLFLILRLHRFVKIKRINKTTVRSMLRYSTPLMPTAISWWVTNISDRYFVAYMLGLSINGLYSAAYKIPTLITQVSAIFIQAWQLSAFEEYQSKEGERFYSTVFKCYYTFVFLLASLIILLVKPIIHLMTGRPEYFEAWRFVPFLVLAVSFSCLVTFLGTIYNAVKKNTMVTVSSVIGAGTNIGLNALLIPKMGANGAALATFISFLLVFCIRAIDTRKYMNLHMQPLRIIANLLLLLVQTWAALSEFKYWVLCEVIVFILLVVCNFGYILFILRKLYTLLPWVKRRPSQI